MRKQLTVALVASAPMICALPAFAEDLDKELAQAEETSTGFVWEGEIELGYESLFDSDVPVNEGDAAYATGEFVAEIELGQNLSLFGGLTFEEVEDPAGNTGYGFYIHELGLQFGLQNATFQIGKVSPTFGTAWDSAAGFFSSALAEDYELTEQLGGLADVELGDGSLLSLGVFFADNSVLSESAGFNRTRNDKINGGAGNTGTLNNASVQWTKETGATYFYLGGRFLSAGVGDTDDETGFVGGIGHSFTPTGVPLDLFAEVASFDGYGGVAGEDATYATLNAAYAIGEMTLSGAYARRDITSAGVTEMYTISAEYEFQNGVLIGAGLADVDDAGTSDKLFGVNIVFPLGS